MKIKVVKCDSPILKAHGIKIGMIGICLDNDFKEKYQYRVSFKSIQSILYFYEDEVEVIND